MTIFVIGCPGDLGGADTELWHTIRLWLKHEVDVQLVPTWRASTVWKKRLFDLGCVVHESMRGRLGEVPGLAGAMTIGFCNGEYVLCMKELRDLGCKIIWVNCMTFLFNNERKVFTEAGVPDAMVYQSAFQQNELEPQLQMYGYRKEQGHRIHGAFDFTEWTFRPQPHEAGTPFTIGRIARPDMDKWSSDLWKIYESIPYTDRKALLLGVDDKVQGKLGPTPEWASVLKPRVIPPSRYYPLLHCLLPVNGGARENWPQVGLEAFATGVPVVAENKWGWTEMIRHGETGFLGNDNGELAYYAARLAYDEELRLRIAANARQDLEERLANPDVLWPQWERLFEYVLSKEPEKVPAVLRDVRVGQGLVLPAQPLVLDGTFIDTVTVRQSSVERGSDGETG